MTYRLWMTNACTFDRLHLSCTINSETVIFLSCRTMLRVGLAASCLVSMILTSGMHMSVQMNRSYLGGLCRCTADTEPPGNTRLTPRPTARSSLESCSDPRDTPSRATLRCKHTRETQKWANACEYYLAELPRKGRVSTVQGSSFAYNMWGDFSREGW